MEIVRLEDLSKFEDNYYTKNRKLKLEEYDDEGNIIDTIEFSQIDLWKFLCSKNNGFTDISLAKKKDREYFKDKKYELVAKMSFLYNGCLFDEEVIKEMEEIFSNYTIEQIEFALKFKNYHYNELEFHLSMKDYHEFKNKDFIDILNWIRASVGIYYAVGNDGKRGMAYLEKPTLKQAKYQRNNNGKRIVFFSFKDWKEYIVNEDELV